MLIFGLHMVTLTVVCRVIINSDNAFTLQLVFSSDAMSGILLNKAFNVLDTVDTIPSISLSEVRLFLNQLSFFYFVWQF